MPQWEWWLATFTGGVIFGIVVDEIVRAIFRNCDDAGTGD